MNVGLIGLGRLGKEYARILSGMQNVNFQSACSINPEECAWVETECTIPAFSNTTEFFEKSTLDAVFIVSSTDQHIRHIKQSLLAGLHVFCEKPLSSSVEECLELRKWSENYKHLKVMVGFVRRFDASYMEAKALIEQGAIGRPFLIRSQTIDKDDVQEFQIQYARQSGGIFHDYNIHDIDLARWYFSSEVTNVYSVGGAYKYTDFGKYGDADNVVSTCQFDHRQMAVLAASRISSHGHDTYTEITGTEGSLRIGRPSNKNRIEILDRYGIRSESVQNFWERFDIAFNTQIKYFIDSVINDTPITLDIENATANTLVADAMTRSFHQNCVTNVRP